MSFENVYSYIKSNFFLLQDVEQDHLFQKSRTSCTYFTLAILLLNTKDEFVYLNLTLHCSGIGELRCSFLGV